MDTLIHADIFFFVTTIVVVIVGIALTVVLIYLAKILRDIKEVSEQVRQETVLFREDIRDLRTQVRREGFRFQNFITFFKKFFTHKERKEK